MSISERKKIKIRRRALISAVKERRLVDRIAREEFSDALHDILKHRGMHGLINRGDTYVSVRELVRDSILARKYLYTVIIFNLVELPTFSNVKLPKSPKGGERGSMAKV